MVPGHDLSAAHDPSDSELPRYEENCRAQEVFSLTLRGCYRSMSSDKDRDKGICEEGKRQ